MDINEIKKEISKIKRTTFGVSIPHLRKLARTIAKSDYKSLILKDNFETYELKLLTAFTIGYIKDDIATLLKYFENFMPHVNDWAVCDSLCQNFKIARCEPKVVWNFLMKYKNTKSEFESRIVAVMLLSHFLNDNCVDKIINVLNRLDTKSYYSKMGVAWAFATIMGKYPDKCLNFLDSSECKLDNSTYRKTLQKIRESYKVPDKIKEKIKTLKKRSIN